MSAELTVAELCALLDPVMTQQQLRTLIMIAGIQPTGKRRGHVGPPPSTYDAAQIMQVHHEETARTVKQFTDTDWIGAALLARDLIRADTHAGELWWPDGTRAETLLPSYYGFVFIGHMRTPAHRVIWIAADGPIPPGIQVNHINKLRWDNRRANLELVTHANNIWHSRGYPYQNIHDEGRRSRVTLPPQAREDPNQMTRIGGAFRSSWR